MPHSAKKKKPKLVSEELLSSDEGCGAADTDGGSSSQSGSALTCSNLSPADPLHFYFGFKKMEAAGPKCAHEGSIGLNLAFSHCVFNSDKSLSRNSESCNQL